MLANWLATFAAIAALIAWSLVVVWAVMLKWGNERTCTFGRYGGACFLHRLAWWLDAQRWPKAPSTPGAQET